MLRSFIKRHTLWAGLLAVAIPLGVLLGLQYVWLVDLQNKSEIAEKAYLENYLATVTSRVEYFYRKQGERTLNIPDSLFRRSTPDKIAYFLRKRHPEGAKAFFIVNLENSEWDDVVVYDPRQERFTDTIDSGMVQAIFVAIAPWRTLAWKGATVRSQGISVDARDPGNRILFNLITDDDSQLLGVMGMIVDNDQFRREILPAAINDSVPTSENSGPRGQLQVSVHDGEGRLAMGEGSTDDPDSEARSAIGFLFPDWEIAIGGGNMTPEEFAKSNFLLNVSLSALLALALLGGIVMALRVASREIRLSQMKSDFVSNVSHELRTPLASIRVFGEFLRLGRARSLDKSREYGEYIETESRRLTQLINNILDFSKIESGAKTYELQPASIEQIVADAARTLKVGLSHKGFRLAVTSPEEELPAVDVDPDAITQALSNLVDNAVKYSKEPGEIRLLLSRQNGSALITVEDDGIGISGEEQGKIFDRFHRVSTGLVHNVKGSGLGLAIVSHIAQAHGGRVSVDSTPGHGSRFTIALPFLEATADLTVQSEEL